MVSRGDFVNLGGLEKRRDHGSLCPRKPPRCRHVSQGGTGQYWKGTAPSQQGSPKNCERGSQHSAWELDKKNHETQMDMVEHTD